MSAEPHSKWTEKWKTQNTFILLSLPLLRQSSLCQYQSGNAPSKYSQENTAKYRRERERERVRVEESETKCISNHSDGFVLRPKWSGTANTCIQFLLVLPAILCLLLFRLQFRDHCPSQTNQEMMMMMQFTNKRRTDTIQSHTHFHKQNRQSLH